MNKQCTKPNSYSVRPDVDWDWEVKVPLVAAVMTDEVDFVEMLLNAGAKLLLPQNGANPDQCSPGASATTPIHIAVMEEECVIDAEVLETPIKFGVNVNARFNEGYPLAHVGLAT